MLAKRSLVLSLVAFVVLCTGSAVAAEPPDDAVGAPAPLGPFCFHVARVSPPQPVTDIKLFAQRPRTDIPVFGLTGTDVSHPGLSFIFGMGFQGPTDFSFLLSEFLLSPSFRLSGAGFSGALNLQTLAGSGRCVSVDGDLRCGDGTAVSYTPFPCP